MLLFYIFRRNLLGWITRCTAATTSGRVSTVFDFLLLFANPCLFRFLFFGKQWVIDSALEAGMSEEAAKAAGGKIYTSGSYRLRIHEPNSDIDAICVAPQVRRGGFTGVCVCVGFPGWHRPGCPIGR